MKTKIVLIAVALLVLLGFLNRSKDRRDAPAQASSTPVTNVVGGDAAALRRAPTVTYAPPPAAAALVTEPQPKANLLTLILKGKAPALTMEQLEPYLQANHRSAESLLIAYQQTHNRELLDEAIAKYPNDPQVAYTAWFRAQPNANDPDALNAKRQALDNFKQNAPDNSLANYLSAANYFKTGRPDLAVQEVQAGAGKTKFDDYVQNAIQAMQEAYQTAGYSEVEAKLAATTGALLPHLAELKQTGLSLLDLANKYNQSGDSTSAQSAIQMCLDLGQRLNDPNSTTLIQDLVGVAIQRKAYDAMAASATDPATSQAIQARIDALTKYRDDIKTSVSTLRIDEWMQTASPEDINGYIDRERVFGEQKAMQWLANRQKQ
jgi:hypothetical protein